MRASPADRRDQETLVCATGGGATVAGLAAARPEVGSRLRIGERIAAPCSSKKWAFAGATRGARRVDATTRRLLEPTACCAASPNIVAKHSVEAKTILRLSR